MIKVEALEKGEMAKTITRIKKTNERNRKRKIKRKRERTINIKVKEWGNDNGWKKGRRKKRECKKCTESRKRRMQMKVEFKNRTKIKRRGKKKIKR